MPKFFTAVLGNFKGYKNGVFGIFHEIGVLKKTGSDGKSVKSAEKKKLRKFTRKL
jgi:hypothetical protein